MNEVVIFGAGVASILHFGVGFLVGARSHGATRQEVSLPDFGPLQELTTTQLGRCSKHLADVDDAMGRVIDEPVARDDDLRLLLGELLEANRKLQAELKQTQQQLEAIRQRGISNSTTRREQQGISGASLTNAELQRLSMNDESDRWPAQTILAGGEPTAENAQRYRRPFRRPQLIAPYDGVTIPDGGAFRAVQCWDISGVSFSFLFPRSPSFHSVVLALGNDQSPMFLSARIKEVQPFNERSLKEFCVHCQFTARLDSSLFTDLPQLADVAS